MNEIILLFSGDFAPIVPPDSIGTDYFSDLVPMISGADYHITNLECPLTNAEQSIDKTGPAIKASPFAISLLKQARVNMACLANNHIFDYGEAGLLETLQTCEQNGIETLGLVNRPDSMKPWLIKRIKDKKIGFLNYCEHEFSVRGESEFGASGYDPINCYYDIFLLRPQVDYLVVIYHGGNEYYPLPRPGLKKIFHYLADLGADAVIGHHTHVISGFEMYNGKPLVYSLGNFFFPYENEPEEWNFGIICRLAIKEKIDIKLISFLQCKSGQKVVLLTDKDEKMIEDNIIFLSSIINDEDALYSRWNEYVKEKAIGYLKQLPGVSFWGKILIKLGFSFYIVFPNTRLKVIFNFLRCQSHYDIIISSIGKSFKDEYLSLK